LFFVGSFHLTNLAPCYTGGSGSFGSSGLQHPEHARGLDHGSEGHH
jgi:hypothetical protein